MSKGNWTRITHDDRKKDNTQDLFTYHCADGHSWDVTFKQIEQIVESEGENNCPHCG